MNLAHDWEQWNEINDKDFDHNKMWADAWEKVQWLQQLQQVPHVKTIQ